MRIVHLTSVHSHRDTRIFVKMCRSLSAVGHEVHLVVPRVGVPEIESCDGVFIHSIIPPKNRVSRMTATVKKVLNAAAELDGDIYHFHDPEFLPRAPKWQKKLNKPFIYDVHEDYRIKMSEKEWLPRILRPLIKLIFGKIEDMNAARLSAIVVATPSIESRFPMHPMVTRISNYPLRDELFTEKYEEHRKTGLFTYVGAITKLRGAVEMLEALHLAEPEAKLSLAGVFSPESLRAELMSLPAWSRVEYCGSLERGKVKTLLAEAFAGLVLLHPTPAYTVSYPIKLFEYMSAGIPVIASDFPVIRSIIEGAGCGLLVDPQDTRGVAKAMNWLITHPDEAAKMGGRGRREIIEHYNWENEFTKLQELYKNVLNTTSRGAT